MKSKKGWDSGFQLQCVISAKSCWVSNEIAAGSQVSEKLRSLQKGHAMCVMRVEVKKEVLTNASEISAHNRASVYLCARSHLLRLVIESVVLVCWHWDLISDPHRPWSALSDQLAPLICPSLPPFTVISSSPSSNLLRSLSLSSLFAVGRWRDPDWSVCVSWSFCWMCVSTR